MTTSCSTPQPARRVAIYARVSSDQQAEQETIASQQDAAARNVAEVLGKSIRAPLPLLLDGISDWEQSGRDHVVRRYSFRIFHYSVPGNSPTAAGVNGEWLTADEVLDPHRKPISPTALYLVSQCLADAKGRGVRLFSVN